MLVCMDKQNNECFNKLADVGKLCISKQCYKLTYYIRILKPTTAHYSYNTVIDECNEKTATLCRAYFRDRI